MGKYLGSFVDGTNRRNDIAREVIEKISEKLQGLESKVVISSW